MKKQSAAWSILSANFLLIFQLHAYSQNIGIGTTNPKARLHVLDSSVVFSGDQFLPPNPGNPPIVGPGKRMMWYADKAAFRVGLVSSDLWDKVLVGEYSFATGFDVLAHGSGSFAAGMSSNAVGDYSIAMGNTCGAYNDRCVAIGNYAFATDLGAVAIGSFNNANTGALALGIEANANGVNSIAIGVNSDATNTYSVAIGNTVVSSGLGAVSLGQNVTASGNFSMALGNYVSTSGFDGALTIGDNSTTTVMNTFVANGFRARFAGGYRLFTNSAANVGAFLNANANSWAALSDVRLKENFLPVDGESFLQKIAAMPQYTWNYKGQDVKTLRHYGPMAQDFYQAFGKDDLGEIGCDTLINQQDFLGVNLIAIQALEKRTTQLKKETDETNAMLLRRIELLEEQNRRLLQLLEEKRK